eukprot:716375_1
MGLSCKFIVCSAYTIECIRIWIKSTNKYMASEMETIVILDIMDVDASEKRMPSSTMTTYRDDRWIRILSMRGSLKSWESMESLCILCVCVTAVSLCIKIEFV